MQPSARVLDLFAVPSARPLARDSFAAGDLVLSPGRDARTAAWLNPVLARLAVRLDEDPRRTSRDLRVALPVPARDGSWVVEGWGATRFEPGTEPCRDLEVTRRAGHLLHAHLASAVPTAPDEVVARDGRYGVAERIAFGELPAPADAPDLVHRLLAEVGPVDSSSQLVHADLAGNVLLDLAGAPLVIDVTPTWRPVGWSDAVCVVDGVLWHGADRAAIDTLAPDDLRRAVVFRVLSDPEPDVAAYRSLL